MKTNTLFQDNKSILSVLAENFVTFGEQLRAWRKARGLTQEELAKASAVNVSYISNLERGFSANTKSGKPTPSEALCSRFSKVLAVSEDQVRQAAGYFPVKPGEVHDILDIATVMFHDESKLSPEEKEELLRTVRRVAAGMISEKK